ncbi:MAG: hypothetical protein KBS60_00610 [Phascolarctobacterium sp.]|nr:hypothetical protein [Candidatus Phascolarctobacterium caballi]
MLRNYTPHPIKFYNIDNCYVGNYGKLMLKEGVKPVMILPTEGCVRVETMEIQIGNIEGYPLVMMQPKEPFALPEIIEKDGYYIVSLMAAKAIKKYRPDIAGRFLCIAGAVFGENGTVVGCTKLARV